MKDSFFPNSGADMKAFVEYVNHPLFHACWDTGHAHIGGPQYDEIMTLGKRYRFKEDDRLASPQLFMQKQMEKLMYEIGVYILKSYNCYEE